MLKKSKVGIIFLAAVLVMCFATVSFAKTNLIALTVWNEDNYITRGMDPIWFGIFIVLLVQIANITPPVGFNLFLVTGLADESIGFISRSVMPFIVIIVVFAFLLAVFPQIVLFLPNLMAS